MSDSAITRNVSDTIDHIDTQVASLEAHVAFLRQELGGALRICERQRDEYEEVKDRCKRAEEVLVSIGFKKVDNGAWQCQTPPRFRINGASRR